MAERGAEKKNGLDDLPEQNRLAIERVRRELERLKARLEAVEREKDESRKREAAPTRNK